MKTRILMATLLTGIAIAGCSSERSDGRTDDTTPVDTSINAPDTTLDDMDTTAHTYNLKSKAVLNNGQKTI